MGTSTQRNENWRWPPSLTAVGPDEEDAVQAEDAVRAEDAVVNSVVLGDQGEDADPRENLAGLVRK